MRIAHVVDSMEVGGTEILVSQMCRLQRELGHEPSVYAIASLGALGERMQAEGFAVTPNVGRHLLDSTLHFLRIFSGFRPDVAHLHNSTPTIYAASAARMAGVPSIISTRHSLVEPPTDRIAELKYSVAAASCDWIVGICDATVNNVKNVHKRMAHKIVRVYNGAIALEPTAKEHWPPKSGLTLIYVGRLEPVKNHALMLRAFRAALPLMPNLRLWIVGDGSERAMIEKLIAQLGITAEVTLWGQQLDVAPFFSAADVFVMSSTSEGLPMSLLQAFSLGLPAVVTDVGGMAEVVRLAKAGLAVSATHPAEMTAAILRLANNTQEREQMSANAKTAFSAHFGLPTMVDAYLDLYRNSVRAQRAANAKS